MVVDLVIIAILAISIFLGYRKGLVSLAIGLCAFVIAIVVTFVFYKPITNFVINHTQVDEKLENIIIENVNGWIKNGKEDEINNKLINSAKEGMLPQAVESLVANIISGTVMTILFVGIRIALIFVSALANLVAKLPILEQFNKAGGIIYGTLRGLLIVYVALIAINAYSQFNPENPMHQNLNESYVGKIIYNTIEKCNIT